MADENTTIPGLAALTKESDEDYILTGDSVWITVKGFSVNIKKSDEGVICDIYQKGKEMEDTIAATYAYDNELEEEI